MSKDKPSANPNHNGGDNHKRHIDGSIAVRGQIETHSPPSVVDQHNTERREDHAERKKKFIVEILTLLAVIFYAGLTAWQGCLTRQLVQTAHATFNATNRPYVGINGIIIKHIKKDGSGFIREAVDARDRDTSGFSATVEIKNFGPVPATNYKTSWGAFLDGKQGPGIGKETPTILFPGQTHYRLTQIEEPDYSAVMNGAKSLTMEISIEYDGPAGHYEYCSKEEFMPAINRFLDRGPKCSDLK